MKLVQKNYIVWHFANLIKVKDIMCEENKKILKAILKTIEKNLGST